ncbi:MAG: hypothetical protein ACE149_09990 [Armatimonadota bacterium]
MKVRATDEGLSRLLQQVVELSQDQEDALWADFTVRRAREAAAWAAFAAGLVLATRQMRTVIARSAWHGWFPNTMESLAS